MSDIEPQFPLYVPTKGRSQYMFTSKSLTDMNVSHNLVVEPDQVEDYQRAVHDMKLLARVLPMDMAYKTRYELLDDLGLERSTGPGPARNFAWDHSVENGHSWHWVMDDNIRGFYRLNKNRKVICKSSGFWRAMEDFCLRYENIGMAGPQYMMFTPARAKMPPFIMNTRIYSCNLIRNDVPFPWRGRYNEDTIISLDMLKAGWCTVLFRPFLQNKIVTQAIKGGNTDEFYHKEGDVKHGQRYADNGTTAKSQMLADVHPDLAKVVWKFNRVHHTVDYSPFKKQKLVRKRGLAVPKGVNDYGMTLAPLRKES